MSPAEGLRSAERHGAEAAGEQRPAKPSPAGPPQGCRMPDQVPETEPPKARAGRPPGDPSAGEARAFRRGTPGFCASMSVGPSRRFAACAFRRRTEGLGRGAVALRQKPWTAPPARRILGSFPSGFRAVGADVPKRAPTWKGDSPPKAVRWFIPYGLEAAAHAANRRQATAPQGWQSCPGDGPFDQIPKNVEIYLGIGYNECDRETAWRVASVQASHRHKGSACRGDIRLYAGLGVHGVQTAPSAPDR